jgi:hypothetical protein
LRSAPAKTRTQSKAWPKPRGYCSSFWTRWQGASKLACSSLGWSCCGLSSKPSCNVGRMRFGISRWR